MSINYDSNYKYFFLKININIISLTLFLIAKYSHRKKEKLILKFKSVAIKHEMNICGGIRLLLFFFFNFNQ